MKGLVFGIAATSLISLGLSQFAVAAGSDFEQLFAEHGSQALTYHFCSSGYDVALADNCQTTDKNSWMTFRKDKTVEGVLEGKKFKGTWTARKSGLSVTGEVKAKYTVAGPYLGKALGDSGEYESFMLAK